eukprot:TRINITY_DN4122_c1_g1_i1.p1 TRINITY_DN4122_c1_g1~~TRINITY_DN4122_c1_g1_i1.p1  ORF type:complete len:109 (-),score=5.75 TRINITY_DN4122_c1_g1_i1:123-410(-)
MGGRTETPHFRPAVSRDPAQAGVQSCAQQGGPISLAVNASGDASGLAAMVSWLHLSRIHGQSGVCGGVRLCCQDWSVLVLAMRALQNQRAAQRLC